MSAHRASESGAVTTREVVLTFALVLGAGLVAEIVADLTRLPRMIFLLLAGTLLGPSVAGLVDIPLDSVAAELALTLGVSVILFHGGLGLSLDVLRRVALGLGLLVVPGVLLTAVICGAVATAVFDVPLEVGILIGAVLAPTDPAILIPLFERLGVRAKVSQTIVAESGFNDPIGAVLALAVAGIVLHGWNGLGEPLGELATELVISTALGAFFGVTLSFVLSSRRSGIWRESAALATIALIATDYFIEDSAGGSGYLGVFLAGVIIANMGKLRLGMHGRHEAELRLVIERLAEVMVIVIFIILGAALPWSGIAASWAPALAVLATLMFVARPLAVLTCLLPDRRAAWTREELAFLCWTRETGVMPAALAGLMVTLEVPHAELVTVTVALAIIVTLLVQSTTKRSLARRLGLVDSRSDRLPG